MKSYKEFLTEDVYKVLSPFINDVEFFISDRINSLYIHKLVVKNKKEGTGTKFMETLTRYADEHHKRIELDPSKDFGATSVGRLYKFYKRFGFKENKNRNKDFTTSAIMYREPK